MIPEKVPHLNHAQYTCWPAQCFAYLP